MENSEKIKISQKMIIALALVAIIAISAVGTSVAYLMSKTSPLDNSFAPVYVSCEVVKEADGSIRIENTGDITAYMRVAIIANWVNADGNVYGIAPKAGVDYEIVLNANDRAWYEGSDGFYYHALSVEPDAFSAPIIQEVNTLSESPESGYTLSFHVAAMAIQADPARAVESAWGVTVMGTGAIMPPSE